MSRKANWLGVSCEALTILWIFKSNHNKLYLSKFVSKEQKHNLPDDQWRRDISVSLLGMKSTQPLLILTENTIYSIPLVRCMTATLSAKLKNPCNNTFEGDEDGHLWVNFSKPSFSVGIIYCSKLLLQFCCNDMLGFGFDKIISLNFVTVSFFLQIYENKWTKYDYQWNNYH